MSLAVPRAHDPTSDVVALRRAIAVMPLVTVAQLTADRVHLVAVVPVREHSHPGRRGHRRSSLRGVGTCAGAARYDVPAAVTVTAGSGWLAAGTVTLLAAAVLLPPRSW